MRPRKSLAFVHCIYAIRKCLSNPLLDFNPGLTLKIFWTMDSLVKAWVVLIFLSVLFGISIKRFPNYNYLGNIRGYFFGASANKWFKCLQKNQRETYFTTGTTQAS